VKLPDDIDWPTGVLIAGDAMGVAYHLADKIGIHGHDAVAVFGCGPIGLGNILLLDFYGARPLGVDIAPKRLQFAEELGAVATINPKDEDVIARLKELTAGEGPDVCYECAGRPETVGMAFEACKAAGKIGIVGEQQNACFNPSRDLIHKELIVYGAWYWRLCEFFEMARLVREGLDVTRLITHELTLEEAQTGYDLMAAGECGKVIFRQW
jgi:threonine dehydrogenase-like Zn-dependent dehydrogenase